MATPAAVLQILVTANTGQATAQLGRLQGQLQATQATAKRSSAQTAASIGRGAARAATAVGAIGVGSIVAAAKFEDAFADVRKTVDATEPQFARLEKGIREMAKQIPVSAQELAHLAGEAGALGVKTEDLLGFTRVAADLGVATDLSASAAANALARLANIMDTKGEKAFSRLGATLVDLGNKGASTESEISEMALRIAGAGQTIGLTESQVLGFAAALSNVGIRAEAGGSSISRVMLTMQDAVAQGGKELRAFADIAGLSVGEFAKKFKTDAPAAIAEFTTGLDKIKDSGGSVVQTLERVGLNEIRVRDALLRLGGATGEVTKAQNIANKAWGENSALAEEANKRYKTTSSQFQILKNRVFDLGIAFGQDLLPKVNEAMKALGEGNLGGALEVMAELGGKMAARLLAGLVKAFTDSNLLGKLFIAGGIIRLVGGRGAFVAAGAALGRFLGLGIASGAATTVAATGAGGAAAGAAGGGLLGKLKSIKWARIGGLGIGLALADGVLNEFSRRSDAQSGDWQKELQALGGSRKILGFDIDVTGEEGFLNKLTGWNPLIKDSEKATKKLQGVLDDLARSEKAISPVTRRYIEDLADQSGMTDTARASLRKFLATSSGFQDWRDQFRAVADDRTILKLQDNFEFLRFGVGASMRDIMKVVDKSSQIIDQTLGRHSKQGRQAMGENFRMAAGAVAKAMQRGEISTKEGMAKIRSLIEKANLIDPSRKQARAFGREWAKGMDHSREITRKGVRQILKQLGELPPGARRIAAKTALNHIKEAKREGDITAKEYRKIKSNILSTYTDIQVGGKKKSGQLLLAVSKNIGGLATVVTAGMNIIGENTNKSLKAFGAKTLKFALKNPVIKGVASVFKQRGGPIPGTGVGDKVPAMLEPGEFVINKKATKAARPMLEKLNKDVPRFQTGGMVDRTGVQHFAKGGMAAMIAEANKFERRGFPYTWGGGHSGFGIQPVDCSGAVSQVLHAAGLLKAPMVSGDLAHWGKAGKGPLTVYADPGHTFMSLAGKFFGTSSSNPAGGAGWFSKPDRGYLSGFAARTMDVAGGMAEKIKRLLLKGPDGPLKDMGQASLDKTRRAANAYIDKKMPAGAFGGGQTLKDFSKGPGKIVGASVYGFGEPGTGTVGASGVSLPGKPAFAELDMGTALGHLPFGKKVGIEVGGKKAVGIKLDIGAGGGEVGGHHRAIDFWRDLAEKLGLSGSFLGLAKVRGLQQGGVVDRTGVKHSAIAAPFVGSFDKGGEVAKTGLGLLHKGEHVVAMKKGGLVAGGGGAGGGGPDAQGSGQRGVKAFGVERVRQMREKVGTLLGKAIPRMDETIGIAESLAGLTTSPGGSELSKGEVREQMRLQQKLLATMRKTLNISKRAMGIVERTIKRIEDSIKQLERKIKREQKQMEQQVKKLTKFIAVERKKDKPDQKAIEKAQGKLRDVKAKGARPVERWQKDLTRRTEAMSALSRFRPAFAEATTELSGLTGRGGRIFDTTLAIKELRAQGKPQAIGIEDLLAFAEAMRYGAFNRQLGAAGNIPAFAKGGVHRGGLALVGEKGPEVVQMPPAQVFPTGTGPAPTMNFDVRVFVGDREITDIVRTEISETSRKSTSRYRAGVRP